MNRKVTPAEQFRQALKQASALAGADLSQWLDGSSLADHTAASVGNADRTPRGGGAHPPEHRPAGSSIGAAELAAAAAAAGADAWTPPPSAPAAAPVDWEARQAEWSAKKRERERLADARFAHKMKRSAERAAELAAERAAYARELAELGDADEGAPPTSEELRAELFPDGMPEPPPAPSGPPPRPRNRKARRVVYAIENERRRRGDYAERSKQQAEREKRNAEHVARHRQKWLKRYGGDDAPPTIPRELWIKCQLMRADKRTCEYYLSRVESNPTWVGAVRNSARVALEDGTTRYTFYDQRARIIATLAVAIRELGHDTRRSGPFDRLTRGINRCALALLVRDPAGTDPHCDKCKNNHPSFAALTGVHRPDGTLQNGQIGWIRALAEGGAIDVPQQFKHPVAIAACCKPWELGEAGYPCNWYWSLGAHFDPRDYTDEEIARFEALRELGTLVFDDADATPRRVSYRRPELQRAERPPPPS